MLGLHGIMASSHQLIHKHHAKKSDPQTSMHLKKTGGFWFVDRYNGQCFADVKTATQKKKSCRSSSKSGHLFFVSGPNCSAVLDLFEYYSTIRTCYSDIIYIECYSVHSSITVLNVLYIYTHYIYIYTLYIYTHIYNYVYMYIYIHMIIYGTSPAHSFHRAPELHR